MNETVSLILYNILITELVFLTLLVFNALITVKKNEREFDITILWRQTKIAIGLGAFLLAAFSVLMEISPEFDVILTAIGFNTNATPVALALAITAIVVKTVGTQKRLDGE